MPKRLAIAAHDRLWMAGVVLLGAALRWVYLLKTPHGVRAHDFESHLEYVFFVANTWQIPPGASGWEFYQPPLSYVLYAVIVRVSRLLSLSENGIMWNLQFMSLLLSVALVLLSVWLGRQLFTNEQRLERLLFSLLIAVFPALIYVTPRISNDSFSQVFAFATVAFLAQWWRNGKLKDWYAVSVMIALGLLTKSTALLFLPIVALCWWFRRPRPAVKHLIAALLVIIALTSWLYILRATESETRNLIPQQEGLDPGVLLANTPRNFLTFNPIEVVRIPYNHPWEDAARRQYFWEYFFRSAFLGEWNFGETLRPMGSLLVFLGLGLLALAVMGCGMCIRRAETMFIPIGLAGLAVLAGAVTYRYFNTCSCSQDIRYSTILLVPFAFLVAFAAGRSPNIPRFLSIGLITVFATVVSVFILLIPSAR